MDWFSGNKQKSRTELHKELTDAKEQIDSLLLQNESLKQLVGQGFDLDSVKAIKQHNIELVADNENLRVEINDWKRRAFSGLGSSTDTPTYSNPYETMIEETQQDVEFVSTTPGKGNEQKLRATVAKLKKKVKQLNAQIEELEHDLRQKNELIEKKENNILEIKSQLHAIQESLQDKQNEIDLLNERNQDLQSEQLRLNRIRAQKDQETAKIQLDFKDLKQNNDSLRQKYRDMLSEKVELVETISELEAIKENNEITIRGLNSSLENVAQDRQDISLPDELNLPNTEYVVDYFYVNYKRKPGCLYLSPNYVCFVPSKIGKFVTIGKASFITMDLQDINYINKISMGFLNRNTLKKTTLELSHLRETYQFTGFTRRKIFVQKIYEQFSRKGLTLRLLRDGKEDTNHGIDHYND
eukprot:TRINITY_DN11792_c0_g1_i1.p1 TRINITY_DN11792_c0_g1~~TRINITY_DN11792_c0_g1_i1.p1  ORF type:complete len:412 (-),score=90.16 TRINITY_DN11792_c0_g1_i1:16-1251(-)